MQQEQIKQLIESTLSNAEVMIEGDGTHFTVIVISPLFEQQSRVKRQQLVYDAVRKELLDGSLHALSIKTYTPDEWKKQV
ncbi:MAG: cell division protein BolA [Gammaproteobacteria bacterium RIFCSPHIGHO2_12_FULL_38_14]|nr:MAG: cell division protein BolA [Gammaproteobacteria bacterium RIFCSPHIGHO2_12_FULL_38_14]